MNLDAIGNIGEAVGAVAVVVSLVYLMIQLRQNTRTIRSATYQSIVATAAACNQTLTQNKELARVMRLGGRDPSQLDADEQVQFSFLGLQFFDIFENLYLQHAHGILEEDYWRSRCRSFFGLFDNPGFRDLWSKTKHNYSSRFREFVDGGGGTPSSSGEPGGADFIWRAGRAATEARLAQPD